MQRIGPWNKVALRAAGRRADSSLVVRKLSAIDLQLFAAPSYLARHAAPDAHPAGGPARTPVAAVEFA